MQCPNCNNEVSDNAKFCTHCGSKLPQIAYCWQCGVGLPQNAKFCPQCGTPQNEKQIIPSEQTVVTIPKIEVEMLCPHCQSQYIVREDKWGGEGMKFECAHWHNTFDIAFCGYCTVHKGYVAFRAYNTSEIIGAIAAGAISGYDNPQGAISNLIGSFFDSTPKAKAMGVCPKCQQEFVKCPTCNRAVHITYEDAGVVTCPDCHLRFKMN